MSVLKTLRSMLKARRYDVPEGVLQEEPEDGVFACIVSRKMPRHSRLGIVFLTRHAKAVGVAPLRTIADNMKAEKPPLKECIVVVCASGLTPSANAEVKSTFVSERKVRIQCLSVSDLQVDITKHVLVPKYSEVDVSEIPNGVTVDCLPELPLEDPVSKYFGLQVGSVLKCVRADARVGCSTTYVVVK